jgi:hypothetical protein
MVTIADMLEETDRILDGSSPVVKTRLALLEIAKEVLTL